MADTKLLRQELAQDPRHRENFKDVTIYGLAGTKGSGKGSLMDMLVEQGSGTLNNTSEGPRQHKDAKNCTIK